MIQTHDTSVWAWEDMKAALDAIITTVDFQAAIERHLDRLRILEREMEVEMEFVRKLVADAIRTCVPKEEEEEEL